MINVEHGDLHNVAGSSLNRHVNRLAFSGTANVGIAIRNTRQRTNATVDRTYVTMFACAGRNFIHVTANSFVGVVVVCYHFLCFLPTDANSLRQTPWFNRVGDGKVDDLGEPTGLPEFLIGVSTEHQSRGAIMNIFAFLKSLEHDGILRDVCKQSQFELRVIGGNNLASLFRHKSSADAPSKITTNRDVLQIRLAGRQTTRGSNGLVELAMNAPVGRDLMRQSICIDTLKFVEFTEVDNHSRQLKTLR